MHSTQRPWLLVIMMCFSCQVPWIMFPSTFLKLPFFCLQLCTCVLLHLRLKRWSRGDSEGNHVHTQRGKNSETVYKAGWEISASQPGGNQLWASSGNIQEVLLTSQKAGQIRQITTLGESISHIPECRARESGVALESQVSWLEW